jgi:hypothetical protein
MPKPKANALPRTVEGLQLIVESLQDQLAQAKRETATARAAATAAERVALATVRYDRLKYQHDRERLNGGAKFQTFEGLRAAYDAMRSAAAAWAKARRISEQIESNLEPTPPAETEAA